MEAPIVTYGVYGFFGNALSNACKILGYTEMNEAENEKIKSKALEFVKEKEGWDFENWHDWKPLVENKTMTQSAKFSKRRKGRSPECSQLVDYNLFVIVIFEGSSEEIDKLIQAYTGLYPSPI